MKTIRVRSLKNHSLIAEKCFVADRFFARLKGLVGTTRLAPGEGLLLSPCNDIHMWFMSIAIDAVFVRPLQSKDGVPCEGERWVVTSVREGLRPWKLLPVRDGRARATIELPVGSVQAHSICAGDELCLS